MSRRSRFLAVTVSRHLGQREDLNKDQGGGGRGRPPRGDVARLFNLFQLLQRLMEVWPVVILALPPSFFFFLLPGAYVVEPALSVLLPFLSRLLIIFTFFDAALNPEADGVPATRPSLHFLILSSMSGACVMSSGLFSLFGGAPTRRGAAPLRLPKKQRGRQCRLSVRTPPPHWPFLKGNKGGILMKSLGFFFCGWVGLGGQGGGH